MPVPTSGWSWSIFWVVCPLLMMVTLLAMVVLIALFRVPKNDVLNVLAIFASALVRLAERLPLVGGAGGKGADRRGDMRDSIESGTEGGDRS